MFYAEFNVLINFGIVSGASPPSHKQKTAEIKTFGSLAVWL